MSGESKSVFKYGTRTYACIILCVHYMKTVKYFVCTENIC